MTTRRRFLQAAAIQGLAGGFGSAFARAKPEDILRNDAAHDPQPVRADERLARLLAPIRDEHHLPGLIGAILTDHRLAIGAVGVRKLGSPEPIRVTDRMHLGSNTKAMTATLLGTLVEEGKLSWGSTVQEVFPDLAPQLHPDYRAVTLLQLLTHRSGMPRTDVEKLDQKLDQWFERHAAELDAGRPATEQRRLVLKAIMSDPPRTRPGSAFAYSNYGYIIAGLMAEQVTGRPWESLMTLKLFEPLGMSSAGFGPPGQPGEVDQPWGHLRSVGPLVWPTREDVLPPWAGPAGTVHCSVPDWSKFAALHLAAAQGTAKLLKPATFRVLQTPPPGSDYACGWIVAKGIWAGGRTLYHEGFNQAWYANLGLAPARNLALLVATNRGDSVALTAVRHAFGTLIRSLDLPDDVFARP
jgi:CubicO group peptidase (beta-lactamase class C family)